MATGIVKRYSEDRGFGLLFRLGTKADTPEVFFHARNIIGSRAMEIGAEVRFQLIRSEKRGQEAVNVELLELGGRRTLREAEGRTAPGYAQARQRTPDGKGGLETMPTTVAVTGVAEVNKFLTEAPKLIVARAFHRAFIAADNVFQSALAVTEPHGKVTAETGATLSESRTSEITLDSQLRGGTLDIGYGKLGYIANFVEYGHELKGHKPGLKLLGHVQKRPFMRPAFDQAADEALEAFADVLIAELREMF